MLDARDQQLIQSVHVHLFYLIVTGQCLRGDCVLEVLGASLHHIVELKALRQEQNLDGASLLHQKLPATLGQLNYLILIGQFE